MWNKFKSHLYGLEIFKLEVDTACFSWFKSHLYGIEMVDNPVQDKGEFRLNRTFMELKYSSDYRVWNHIRTLIKRKRKSARERKCGFYMLLHLTLWKFLNE